MYMKEIRNMLCDELDDIVKHGEMTPQTLDMIDKLTHSIKSIDTIEAMKESGYSKDYSERRGRDAMGRYTSRDYSEADRLMKDLDRMSREASNDSSRRAYSRAADELRRM